MDSTFSGRCLLAKGLPLQQGLKKKTLEDTQKSVSEVELKCRILVCIVA